MRMYNYLSIFIYIHTCVHMTVNTYRGISMFSFILAFIFIILIFINFNISIARVSDAFQFLNRYVHQKTNLKN